MEAGFETRIRRIYHGGIIGEDGTAKADCPAPFTCEDDLFEAVGNVRIDVGPCGTAVAGTDNDAIFADRPTVGWIGEIYVVKVDTRAGFLLPPERGRRS